MNMDKIKVKEIIDKTEVFLLDMDGTIYLDSTPIGDMINTLKKIRKAGKKIVYFTNNSSKTVDEYEKKLKKIGFWEENDEVYLNEFDYPNACTYEELSAACPIKNEKYSGQELTLDKLNIICGSFYMLSEILDEKISF